MSGFEGAVDASDIQVWMHRQGWEPERIDAAVSALVRLHMIAAPSVLRVRWDAVVQGITARFRRAPLDAEAA